MPKVNSKSLLKVLDFSPEKKKVKKVKKQKKSKCRSVSSQQSSSTSVRAPKKLTVVVDEAFYRQLLVVVSVKYFLRVFNPTKT